MKFNSYAAQLIYRCLTKKNMGLQGYEPLYDIYTPSNDNDKNSIEEYDIDKTKIGYLERLFYDAKCRNIPIICILTPEYPDNLDIYQYKEGLELCETYGVPVINHKYYDGITQNADLFFDIAHLNDIGANLYSSVLSREIRSIIN